MLDKIFEAGSGEGLWFILFIALASLAIPWIWTQTNKLRKESLAELKAEAKAHREAMAEKDAQFLESARRHEVIQEKSQRRFESVFEQFIETSNAFRESLKKNTDEIQKNTDELKEQKLIIKDLTKVAGNANAEARWLRESNERIRVQLDNQTQLIKEARSRIDSIAF